MSEECLNILKSLNHCEYAKENCESIHVFYFCTMNESPATWVLMALLFVVLIFILGTTADKYFSPALSSMSKAMKLSDTIAGVTLLAFGNGAPDVFSSILAATRMEIGLSIGGLLGGSIFVTMIVLGRVVLVSGECKIDTNKTIRDCVLLIITVMLILIYGLIGVITLFQACLFPLLYVFYVFSVFQMEKKTQKLLENSFEMPILERNYVNWVDIIDDYIETNPKKLETQPYLKKDEFQWSSIKQSLYEEKK